MATITELQISGSWMIEADRYPDDRGWFQELYKQSLVRSGVLQQFSARQLNLSRSNQGVVRGIHFSSGPAGQAKYVSVLSGIIDDIVVDIRVGSPTFGKWQRIRLDSDNPRSIVIDAHLGHAFQAISSEALVCYAVSSEYDPTVERGINPNCPLLEIDWNRDCEIRISDKDRDAPSLKDALRLGVLPELRSGT